MNYKDEPNYFPGEPFSKVEIVKNKCPKCGAPAGDSPENQHWFSCGSHYLVSEGGEVTNNFYQEIDCKLAAQAAEIEELEQRSQALSAHAVLDEQEIEKWKGLVREMAIAMTYAKAMVPCQTEAYILVAKILARDEVKKLMKEGKEDG